MVIRRAKEGESIYATASEWGLAPQYLKEISGINSRILAEGREVGLITPSRTYVVRRSDTLGGICKRFSVSEREVIALNPELSGGRRVYPGQYLVLKLADVSVGVGVKNGYIYRGVGDEQLSRVLPYLDILTVGAAYAVGKKIEVDRSLDFARRAAIARGVTPLLRIYIRETSRGEEQEFIIGACCLAKSYGYAGVVLGGFSALGGGACEFLVEFRRRALDEGLLVGVEGVLGQECAYTEYADLAMMSYDKLENEKIEGFCEGERAAIIKRAEAVEVANTLVDLPAFALMGARYLSRRQAFNMSERRGAKITHDDGARVMRIREGRREAICESMANVEGRIIAAAECGYLGVSYDVGRVPFSEIFMAHTMLSRAACLPLGDSPLNCRGEIK